MEEPHPRTTLPPSGNMTVKGSYQPVADRGVLRQYIFETFGRAAPPSLRMVEQKVYHGRRTLRQGIIRSNSIRGWVSECALQTRKLFRTLSAESLYCVANQFVSTFTIAIGSVGIMRFLVAVIADLGLHILFSNSSAKSGIPSKSDAVGSSQNLYIRHIRHIFPYSFTPLVQTFCAIQQRLTPKQIRFYCCNTVRFGVHVHTPSPQCDHTQISTAIKISPALVVACKNITAWASQITARRYIKKYLRKVGGRFR
ncbi:MAG TPA: hypothetical protein VGM08_00895 [Candidatus Saccharimonadales bacterium]